MVVLTDLAATGGFAYSAWTVLGSLHRYLSAASKRFGDAEVIEWHAELLAEVVKSGDRSDVGMGTDPSQRHIFEHWKALNTTQRVALLESLAQLLAWSGQASRFPALQRAGPSPAWSDLNEQQRKELLVAADQLNFDFIEDVLTDGEYVSGNQSLWQVTEAPAMLSAEPLVMRDVTRMVSGLRDMVPHLEAKVKAAFAKAKAAKVQALKGAAEGLSILPVLKQLAELQVALQKQVGLTADARKQRCAELKALLEDVMLLPAGEENMAGKQEAAEKVEAALDEAILELQQQQAAAQEEAGRSAAAAELSAQVALLAAAGEQVGIIAAAEAVLEHSEGEQQLRLLQQLAAALVLSEEQQQELQQLLEQLQPQPAAAAAAGEEEEQEQREQPTPASEILSQISALLASLPLPLPEQPAAAAEEEEQQQAAAEYPADKKAQVKQAIADAVSAKSSEAQQQLQQQHSKQLSERRQAEQRALLDSKYASIEELAAGEALLVREMYTQAVAKAAATGDALLARVDEILGAIDQADLDANSSAAVSKALALASEARLVDAVTKLELGSETAAVLAKVQEYLKARDAAASEEDGAVDVVSEPLEKVSELLREGLVALQLSSQQYRKLRELKEVIGELKADGEGLSHDRHLRLLKELVQQLGPIGAAVQARLGEAQDEAQRGLLQGQKDLALGLYEQLSGYLAYEDGVQGAGLRALQAAKDSVGSAAINKSSAVVGATLGKLAAALQQLTEVGAKLAELPAEQLEEGAVSSASAASAAAVEVGQRVAKVQETAAYYLQFVRLRELALGGAAAAAEGLELGSLADLKLESELPLAVAAEEAEEEVDAWRAEGLHHIAHGRVAVVMVAGSMVEGSPAGCKDVGLASGKSLFQLYAERLLRLQRLAAEATFGRHSGAVAPINWYIMTSPASHAATKAFFKRHGYFGLSARQVHVFQHCQRAPLLSEELKVIMETPAKLAQQPDAVGAGDLLVALEQSGMMCHIGRSGAKYVEIQGVEDNALARLADPVFLGYLTSGEKDVAAKVIEPAEVEAAYGALAAPLGEEMRNTLAFTAPATGQFVMTAAFLRAACKHVKDNPSALYRLVPQGDITARATKVAGYRLQRQLVDLLLPETLAALGGATAGLLGVDAKEEFSQVFGVEPWHVVEADQAVSDLMEMTSTWVEASGGEVKTEQGVEVSPLVSYAGEGLQGLCAGKAFEEPFDNALQGAAAGPGQPRSNAGPWLVPIALAYAGVAVLKVLNAGK